VKAAAFVYPGLLICLVLFFRLVGERWWLLSVLAYLPQAVFGLPLPLLSAAMVATGQRRLLWTQLLCLLLLLFPLMGLNASLPRRDAAPAIRILTYNVWLGTKGPAALEKAVSRAKPDVVLLQASSRESAAVLARLPALAGFAVRHTGRYTLASRFPVVDLQIAEGEDGPAGPPFVRYTLNTSWGFLDVLNCHPLSIRTGVESIGPLRALREKRLPRGLLDNLRLRERQVALIASTARASPHRVVVAGDLNLPQASRILRDHLSTFRDAFTDAGNGFGYTFPGDGLVPWMRIDRILSSKPGMRFTGYEVADCDGSDHCSVTADLVRVP
jgi:vancomycin resistance protein VanJ